MQVFTLSRLTRDVAAQRRVVIQGFDLPFRGLMIAGASFVPAVVVTIILWPLFGSLAIIAIPVVELAAFWLIETRTRSGLRLRRYQAFVDSRRSIAGKFVCCGEVIDPLHGVWGRVAASSISVEPFLPPMPTRIDAVFETSAPSPRKKDAGRHG